MNRIIKIFTLLLSLFIFSLPVLSTTLSGEVNFVWDKLSQTERDEDISAIKEKVFAGQFVEKYNKKEFKGIYRNFFKDGNYKTNMLSAKAGILDFPDRVIVPFYYKKLLYGYGLIYKNDLKHCYYYSALGGLFVVEVFQHSYNDYPVISYQYNKSGILIGTVYANSSADDYMYFPDGKFAGRWYGENYYSQNGKIKMTRILP